MTKLKIFFLTLFLGHENSRPKNRKVNPAIKNQIQNVKRIWNNEKYNDFGLERIIRLSLAISLFFFPGLYVRSFSGQFGLLARKIGVEIYVVFKLLLPLFFFQIGWTNHLWVAIIAAIMATETVIYLATIIYLSNEFTSPISYRRSLTTLFFNYMEICLNFAIIYSYCNYNIPDFFKNKLTSGLDAIYFSFVTSTTVGFGDIVVNKGFGQFLVIIQSILFLVFVGLFINYFTSNVQTPTYYNQGKKTDIKK
ncbi:potassium channel protein [bacterium]|nr:MAG: potassium channel protein [bacterium]